jgi:hypothetical protein
MVACASGLTRRVRQPIGSSYRPFRGGRNSCLALSSEQRRLASGSERGHRFHRVAAGRGERARGFRSLIQVGEWSRRSSTADHVNARGGRLCKLVIFRDRTCRFDGFLRDFAGKRSMRGFCSLLRPSAGMCCRVRSLKVGGERGRSFLCLDQSGVTLRIGERRVDTVMLGKQFLAPERGSQHFSASPPCAARPVADSKVRAKDAISERKATMPR